MITKPYQNDQLSLLGMGNMRLPLQGTDGPIDRVKAAEMIDYGYRHGVNYYDTAYVYHSGESESAVGEMMQRYPRESFRLATKFLYAANPDYRAVFAEQLERLRTDYIDFYLIHAINDHSAEQYLQCGCIDYFLEQQKRGRIRHLGFSAHCSLDTLKAFAAHHAWDFAQLQLNYLDWEGIGMKRQYEALTELGIPVVVMEPLRGGRLAELSPASSKILKDAQPDWSIPSWAFRWLMRLPNVQVILSGMSTLEQMQDNVHTFETAQPLTDEEDAVLQKAAEVFRKEITVPCTACRYCCDDCPAHIDIPRALECCNRYQLSRFIGDLAPMKKWNAGPADCIGCGACTAHCPQNIAVPELMAEMARILQG